MIEEKRESFFKEMIRFAILTALIVFPIRIFIADPFIVSGHSMDPTFASGEYLIVDQLSYRFEEPKRGEVVIFKYPKDPKKYFIKRIIGLPGETVILDGTSVSILDTAGNTTPLDQSYIQNTKEETGTYALNNNEYFVMGDNRSQSSDSRIWGAVPRENIVGRAFLRLLPVQKTSIFPGNHSE